MSGMDECRITVETLENGYEVTIPDWDEMAKKEKEAKKARNSMPYMGDCTKSYMAKSISEVIKMVKACLEKMPDQEYDKAFEEAGGK